MKTVKHGDEITTPEGTILKAIETHFPDGLDPCTGCYFFDKRKSECTMPSSVGAACYDEEDKQFIYVRGSLNLR